MKMPTRIFYLFKKDGFIWALVYSRVNDIEGLVEASMSGMGHDNTE